MNAELEELIFFAVCFLCLAEIINLNKWFCVTQKINCCFYSIMVSVNFKGQKKYNYEKRLCDTGSQSGKSIIQFRMKRVKYTCP